MTSPEKTPRGCSWIGRLAAIAALSLAAAGCAATRGPGEILAARSAYDRAVTGPAAGLAPGEIATAAVALNMAERADEIDPGSRRSRELAYIAARYAELAIARAGVIQAWREKEAAERDLARARRELEAGPE